MTREKTDKRNEGEDRKAERWSRCLKKIKREVALPCRLQSCSSLR